VQIREPDVGRIHVRILLVQRERDVSRLLQVRLFIDLGPFSALLTAVFIMFSASVVVDSFN